MVSPDSRCPPGDETITSIGSTESASSAINRRAASAALASVIVPKMSTVRDLKAFSSKNALLGAVGPGGVGVSIDSPRCMLNERDPPFVTGFQAASPVAQSGHG